MRLALCLAVALGVGVSLGRAEVWDLTKAEKALVPSQGKGCPSASCETAKAPGTNKDALHWRVANGPATDFDYARLTLKLPPGTKAAKDQVFQIKGSLDLGEESYFGIRLVTSDERILSYDFTASPAPPIEVPLSKFVGWEAAGPGGTASTTAEIVRVELTINGDKSTKGTRSEAWIESIEIR
jgi:hypothetical protein